MHVPSAKLRKQKSLFLRQATNCILEGIFFSFFCRCRPATDVSSRGRQGTVALSVKNKGSNKFGETMDTKEEDKQSQPITAPKHAAQLHHHVAENTGGGRCNCSHQPHPNSGSTPGPGRSNPSSQQQLALPLLSDSNPIHPMALLRPRCLTSRAPCPPWTCPQHDAMLRTASDRWTILLGSREGKETTLPVQC